MYADETGLQFCIDCPAGQFLELSMSDSVEDCLDCDVGKYVGSTGSDHVSHCSKCPPGMYGDQTGLVVCEECGVGGYMPEEGALGRQAITSKFAHSCNWISEFTSTPSLACLRCCDGAASEGAVPSFCTVSSCPHRSPPYKREWNET